MDRKTVTIAVVLVLFAAAFAFSRGWFSSSIQSPISPENTKVSASDTMEQGKVKVDAGKLTQETQKPAGSTTQ